MKLATRIFRRNDWYVTSPFGYRKDPITGETAYHSGCDYGTHVQKWPQYALEDGVVLSAGKDSSGAIFAWVRYPRLGIDLLHYHLDSLCVRSGQAVNASTIIGYTGTTGRSTGIHLHLGKRKSGYTAYEDAHAYDYQEYVAPAPVDPFPGVSDEALAARVWAGEFGNGDEREAKLGIRYDAVQVLVNKGVGKPEPKPEPIPEPKPTPQPTVDILDLVRRTIRGDFGNGTARRAALGSNYTEVQRQVNLNVKNRTTRWDNIRLY